MQLAYELGKDYEEVLTWDPQKYARWCEFLILRAERIKAAQARNRPR